MKDDNIWEVDTPKCHAECPEIEEPAELVISDKAYKKIRTLLHELDGYEWVALMTGYKLRKKKDNPDRYFCEDIRIIDQEVGKATVSTTKKGSDELARIENVIGWLHSHNSMGQGNPFLSSTDDLTGKQWPITVSVNDKMEFKATSKKKVSCGIEVFKEVEVIESFLINSKFWEKVKNKINIPKPSVYQGYGGYYGSNVFDYYDHEDIEMRPPPVPNTKQGFMGDKTGAVFCKYCRQTLVPQEAVFCNVCGTGVHEGCQEQGVCITCRTYNPALEMTSRQPQTTLGQFANSKK